jgi:hypothetical protein
VKHTQTIRQKLKQNEKHDEISNTNVKQKQKQYQNDKTKSNI